MNRLTTIVVVVSMLGIACREGETSSGPILGRAGARADAGGRAGAAATAGRTGSAGTSGDAGAAEPEPEPDMLSKPGKYKGYSEPIYPNGYVTSSQYVAVRDGTQLAIDIHRPKAEDGSAVTARLPVLFMHTPYNRRSFRQPNGMSGPTADTYPGFASRLIEYGYVVAVADFRGLYASYGKNVGYNRGEWVEAAKNDAYDLIEWLAEQPFSDGKIGMWGCSATGGSQLQAASTAPPHLEAIFPMSCEWDIYNMAVIGGVAAPKGMPTNAPPTGVGSAAQRDSMAEPVDGDADRTKLMAAIAEHAMGVENPGYAPFRDSVAENIPEQWWLKSSPHTYLEQINRSGVAMYLAANWDEGGTKHGAFFTFRNVSNPAKLIVGPGAHCAWSSVKQMTGFDLVVEELRFFDYYLKDVKNGIADEPKVTYYTYNAPAGQEWRTSETWPIEKARNTNYYLSALKSLNLSAPSGEDARDEVVVEYDVTPENMLEKGLVFESYDVSVDLEVTGHPKLDLWVSSTATDGDVVATIQDVAPDGTAVSYNMTGRLRASHRKTESAPYEYFGLPWHPSREADVMPLVPGEPTKLEIELLPISIVFKKGHRIRLVLNFAAGAATPRLDPPPTVTLYRDPMHRSVLVLPVVPGGSGPGMTASTSK